MADITVDTPVSEVKDNRPNLVRLARTVCGCLETAQMKAFSQFPKSDDLVRIIEAKRAGTFHYDQYIKANGQGGYTFPSAAEVLALLETAEKATPNNAPQRVETPPVRREEPVQSSAPSQSSETPTAPDSVALLGPIMARFDAIESAFGAAFKTLDGRTMQRLDAARNDLTALRRGFIGLVGCVEVLAERQKVIATYLDEYAELPSFTEPMLTDLAALREGPMDTIAAQPVSQPEEKAPEPAQPSAPAAAAKTEVKPAPSGGTVTYTKEQLTEIGNRSLSELQAIADQVGVPGAKSIAFVAVLVSKILNQANKVKTA